VVQHNEIKTEIYYLVNGMRQTTFPIFGKGG